VNPIAPDGTKKAVETAPETANVRGHRGGGGD
jgi:hypothetical protein